MWRLGLAFVVACTQTTSTTPTPTPTSPPVQPAVVPPDASPPTPTPPPGTLAIRLTPTVAVQCGPDYLERHARSLSDLDGDGTLDRPSVVRTKDALVVKLYEVPSFKERGSWKLTPGNAYVELATPQRRGSSRGDLWIMVGVETAPSKWTSTLYHLENGALVAVATSFGYEIRIDVDGDGRVDPIAVSDTNASKLRALLASRKWLDLPSAPHGVQSSSLHEEPADLDRNGTLELAISYDDRLAIVETPSMREVWRVKGQSSDVGFVTWNGARLLATSLDDKVMLFATDASRAKLFAPTDADSFSHVATAIGKRLVVTGVPWRYYERASAKAVATSGELLMRMDDKRAPYGPVKLLPNDAPSLVTFGAAGEPVELRLLDPATSAKGRVLWRGEDSPPQYDVNGWLVDLDRDGASEVLLEEIWSEAFHHGSSWNTMKFKLLDGRGTMLWEEGKSRTDSWAHSDGNRGRMTQIERDDTKARAVDLNDGTTALRIRSAVDEFYIVPARSKLTTIPPCLE